MEIPLLYLTKKLCKEVGELYGFEAGMSPEELPPLATFSPMGWVAKAWVIKVQGL